ncbi:MAG: Pterin binding enzyme [Chloroflexi bacterium]|nr:Pterin binding enzyme [Chloroflexota bacterium]
MAEHLTTILSSQSKTVKINRLNPTVIIGERINPTGRKVMLEALQQGNFDLVRKDALSQVAAGASVLDVNAGVPGADEPALLKQVMQAVMEVTDAPLCIDTNNPSALAAALPLYQGKALVNSVNGEEHSLNAVLPLVKEHGAVVIGLCMDDSGIPKTAQERLAVAARIIERAGRLGIPVEDVVIDPLTLTMGSDSLAGRVTLDTVALVVQEFGVNVSMGASNVSFGLPDRKYVNATFIAMAIQAGVTCPITNPLVMEVITAILAADLALGRDNYAMRWIKAYRKRAAEVSDQSH